MPLNLGQKEHMGYAGLIEVSGIDVITASSNENPWSKPASTKSLANFNVLQALLGCTC